MRTIFITIGVLVLVGVMVSSTSLAITQATVTATVTVQNFSVALHAPGTVAYGTLAQNTSYGTVNTPASDTQEAGNNGNSAEDLNIIGTNSTDWNLSFSSGSQDKYKHTFCTATCSTPPTNYTTLSSQSYQVLSNDLAAQSSQSFDLRITTPNPSTVFTQQSVDVTVQATAP